MNIISAPPPHHQAFCAFDNPSGQIHHGTQKNTLFKFLHSSTSDCLFLEMFTDVTLQLWKTCSNIR